MKTFCIAGPIIPEIHYFIPKRLDWDRLDSLLNNMQYFILHAPRQTGKTTAIREYVKHVNKTSKLLALYLTTEPAHIAKNNIERTVYWLVVQLDRQIKYQLPEEKKAREFAQELLKQNPISEDAFFRFLEFWCENSSKHLAIFFDEVDGLVENSLIFFLKQLRSGYTNRPNHFPQSVCLIVFEI